MNRKEQIIRIGKRLKLNVIKWRFIESEHYLLLLKKYGIFSGELVSFNDLEPTDILDSHKAILSYSPPVFGCEAPSVLTNGMEYVQYAVHLKNATVLGSSNLIVLPSGRVLYDLPFYDVEKRYLYADYKIIKLKDRKITYWKGVRHTIDKAVWMGGNFSWNFYHFIYEFAIKFCKLRELDIPADIPILIDQICLDIPQYREILDMLNKKGHPLVGVAQDEFFEVSELFYVNCPDFIPPETKNANTGYASDIQFDIKALKDLRNFLLPHASLRTFPKRIFLSRKNASDRRRFNEEELIQVCADFGFEVVFPEKLSFCEQMSLFNQAEWIVGGSGAAFTNLLFCKEKSKALIFYKTRMPFSGFSTIAQFSGVDLRYITEETPEIKIHLNTVHDPFNINVSDFRQYLKDKLKLREK